MSLQAVDHSVLQQWVQEELDSQMATKSCFSAHTIKVAVRTTNPGFDIPHGEVRDIVHAYMAVQPDYEGNTATNGPVSFIEYSPIATPAPTAQQPIATAKPSLAKRVLSFLGAK